MELKRFALGLLVVGSIAMTVYGQKGAKAGRDGHDSQIKKVSFKETNKEKRMEISAEYPSLGAKAASAAFFNKEVRKHVMGFVDEFRREMLSMTKEDIGFLPEGVSVDLDIGYKIEFFNGRFASVSFGRSSYTGGAHPNHWTSTLNLDLSNRRLVNLSDLFRPGNDYLRIISRESIASLTKQLGEFSDNEWIGKGAGPEGKNFKSWAITSAGLKFFFDPYDVGPYAAGGFETLVPFSKFAAAGRTDVFRRIIGGIAASDPPNWCRNGLFTSSVTEFSLARVNGTRGSRAYFYRDSDDCPEGNSCRRRSYVIPGDVILVSARRGAFVCAWFQPRKGSETVGWVHRNQLQMTQTQNNMRRSGWLGEWTFQGNDLNITQNGGALSVKGNAFWKGLGDNIHIGEVDENGVPSGRRLVLGGNEQYDCRVELVRIGRFLVASDNKNCGGVNVTFDGVYQKQR